MKKSAFAYNSAVDSFFAGIATMSAVLQYARHTVNVCKDWQPRSTPTFPKRKQAESVRLPAKMHIYPPKGRNHTKLTLI